ncbi:hypothetical protein CHS0354_034113 [Potamilus streckersoni]|uniref:Serpin domain-containing protein n=1 Tax=Potamilus streckersoni TaxID=2493646 RepID=A0AAE0TD56_9BIVA|nr:hypothetical protein CHS0354_034113 [Potamilus streckersoni]
MAQSKQDTIDLPSPRLNDGLTAFSLNLYKLFMEGEENIFLSPYSVCAAMLLAHLGSKGNSEAQIRKVLGLDQMEVEVMHKEFQKMRKVLNAKTAKSTTLAIANRIFAKMGLSVRKEYTEKSLLYHGSEMECLDFAGESEKSRLRINAWVEEQTRQKIKDLLPAGSINSLTLVVLVNAVYFKGDWDTKFDPQKTEKNDFHISMAETVKVDMMHAKRKCRFLKNDELKYSALMLPYKDGNLSMVIVLPYENDGLKGVEKALNAHALSSFCEDLAHGGRPEVIIALPKFKMEITYELTKTLPKLGISDILQSTKADFGAMLDGHPDAFISDVIHKTFIDVNEEGTEAAAATGMMMRCMAMPLPPEEFIADHPFLFLIRDNDTGAILFIGRYARPAQ